MSTYGFVYVLENLSMPDLVKIGYTLRSPHQRALELSAPSGVPTEFYVSYYAELENPAAAEAFIHNQLKAERVNASREFFLVGVEEVMRIVRLHLEPHSESYCSNRAMLVSSKIPYANFQAGVLQ